MNFLGAVIHGHGEKIVLNCIPLLCVSLDWRVHSLGLTGSPILFCPSVNNEIWCVNLYSLYAILQLLRPIYKQIAENQNAEIFSANTLLVILGTSLLTARV